MPDRRDAIRGHLIGPGAEALAAMLLDLVERDTVLLRRLDLAASAATTPAAEHADRLAQASEAALPAEAAAAYRAVIERCIGQTNRGGYEEACRLLARLAMLEPAPAHRALVADLRVRHRPKRSLLPMLDRHLATIQAS